MAKDAGAYGSELLRPIPRGRYPFCPFVAAGPAGCPLSDRRVGASSCLGTAGARRPALVLEVRISRHFKTARARISNRGQLPRFIGLLPTDKSADEVLPFSSLSELAVGLFLDWADSVKVIAYEPREVTFEAANDLPGITGWPDF